MTGHGEDDRGDADQKAQPFGEFDPRVLEIEPLCFAVCEHAFDEPAPPIVSQDARSAKRLGTGHDQQLSPFDAPCAKVQFQGWLTSFGGYLWSIRNGLRRDYPDTTASLFEGILRYEKDVMFLHLYARGLSGFLGGEREVQMSIKSLAILSILSVGITLCFTNNTFAEDTLSQRLRKAEEANKSMEELESRITDADRCFYGYLYSLDDPAPWIFWQEYMGNWDDFLKFDGAVALAWDNAFKDQPNLPAEHTNRFARESSSKVEDLVVEQTQKGNFSSEVSLMVVDGWRSCVIKHVYEYTWVE